MYSKHFVLKAVVGWKGGKVERWADAAGDGVFCIGIVAANNISVFVYIGQSTGHGRK